MKFLAGFDKMQVQLLPSSFDDYICQDNPVRFLNAFVDSLDLAKLGFKFPSQDEHGRGRPGYHPADLLKLYLYGYTFRIRSGRLLEKGCRRNLELIWLLAGLAPDFKTICDFRADNAEAFKKVVQSFTLVCKAADLFDGQLLAVDGTKIKGQNSPSLNYSQAKLEKELKQIAEKAAEYLKLMGQADLGEPLPKRHSAEALKEKINKLRERQSEVKALLDEVQASGQTQVSMTDPDSRSMKSNGCYTVGYNVQAAVDSKYHFILTLEATNLCVDQGQLASVVQATLKEQELQSCKVVADGGYNTVKDIKACHDLGVETHLPKTNSSRSEAAGLYGKEDFAYNQEKDSYTCPNGAELTYRRTARKKEGAEYYNYDNRQACKECPLKSRCTQHSHRVVTHSEHQEEVDAMNARVNEAPEILAKRKTIVEHCFGTLKWLLPGGFLVRGLRKVQAEVSLAQFAYNFRRALKVAGLEKLMAAN